MKKLIHISFIPGWLLPLLFLLSSAYMNAQSADKMYSLGNDAYKAKNYPQAIVAYQQLLAEGYHSAAVYYNLGNAYYKADSISQSILAYERALRLSPADEDIRFNLKLANLKTVDRIIPVPQLYVVEKWRGLISAQSSRSWAIWAVVSIWLSLIAFTLYLFISSLRRAGFYAGGVLLFFSLSFFYLSYTQRGIEAGKDQAILTVSNTYIKSAPDDTSTDLFMIHEGTKLHIMDKVGNWSKIRLADGKVGWVEQNAFTLI
jgi:tetratricopeptide (TPR) repeat protein